MVLDYLVGKFWNPIDHYESWTNGEYLLPLKRRKL
jgi:hypothetical protein